MPRLALALLLAIAPIGLGAAAAQTLRIAYQGDVVSMDPYAVNETFTTAFLSHINEPLVRRLPDLTLEPGLAERWERLTETRWRFHLRRGVAFHEGEPFSAADVVFSLDRVRKPGSALLARVASVKAVTAVDSHTVEIETDGPAPTLLADLTNILIMSKRWAEAHGAEDPVDIRARRENHAARHANGTGPFLVRSYAPGERTVLIRNESWWDRMESNLREVVLQPVGSDPTRVAALLSGQVDLAWPIPVQDIARVAAAPGIRVMEGMDLRTIFLGMDQSSDELRYASVKGSNPLADQRVREAMYRAIDIAAIRTRLMRGRATPTALLNGPGIEGFDAEQNARRPGFDLARARALMAEAGYGNGFELGMHCPNNRYVNDEQICQAVGQMLARIGIRVTLTAEPAAQYFGRAQRRDVSFYMLGTTPPTYDSFSTLFGLVMCREEMARARGWPIIRGQGQFNHGGFCDREADAAIAAARSELDPAKRRAHFATAWRVMIDRYAYIPLHQQALAWGMREGVSLRQRPDDVLDLRFVRVP
ncbi:ABC transporter substrate-binding protein [Elioraea sp.]|uniref:ABC transporter substrate-binding protein n=1 Tax=Elioraea sp. TaxID=2185103 RepID=UPI0021DD8854|nr:ABC transporter substrate-binding protein [Elioraea sp.]GIX10794.1 MAG: ABC transporter substrate-binding protein [Elioraea sp.]